MALPHAETLPGPSTEWFSKVAKELQVTLVIGIMEKSGDDLYNTVLTIGPKGDILGKYRKINLFEHEHDFLVAGKDPVVVEAPLIGRGAIIICSDVYSSFPASEYSKMKVDFTILSTSWAQKNTGWGHFTRYAKQSKKYFIAANQHYFPDTGVINPDGSAQSHIRSENIAYGYLPKKKN